MSLANWTFMRRTVIGLIVVATTFDAAAAAQHRKMAPIERHLVVGDYYLLEPFVADLPQECGCISRPFALPRVARYVESGTHTGEAIPLQSLDPDIAIRVDKAWERSRDDFFSPVLQWNPTDYHSVAQFLVAGRGVAGLQGDDAVEEGVELYVRAARGGLDVAQQELAYLFSVGLGVQQSDEWAVYWMTRAAAQGHSPFAALALGSMYAVGRGVPKNDATAAYWFRASGDPRFIADSYACGLDGPSNLSAARQWYERAGRPERGDIDAQFTLGHMAATGCGGSGDVVKAAELFKSAAEEGHPDAQVALSQMYRDGYPVEPDPLRAYYWSEIAVLRLADVASTAWISRDDELRRRAIEARDSALRMLDPRAQSTAPLMPLCVVAGTLESMYGSVMASHPTVVACSAMKQAMSKDSASKR